MCDIFHTNKNENFETEDGLYFVGENTSLDFFKKAYIIS